MSWHPPHGFGLRGVSAALELFHSAAASRHRPPFGIDHVTVGGEAVPVREQVVLATPFGTLLRFPKEGVGEQPQHPGGGADVGPLRHAAARHGAALLPDHDVYITDWHNARDVPLGRAASASTTTSTTCIRFLEVLGPGCACDGGVPAGGAGAGGRGADGAANDHRCQPRSMTLMAGPIDTRVSPTKVNVAGQAARRSTGSSGNLIGTVPCALSGAARRVYPGFLQLAGVHVDEPRPACAGALDQFHNLVNGDGDERRGAPAVLRRIPGGDGPAGGVLPGDRQDGVPGPRPAAGRLTGAAGRSIRRPSGGPRCSPWKASWTISAGLDRRGWRMRCVRRCRLR